MRWLAAGVVLFVLWMTWLAWPFLGLYQLASAVQARNTQALDQQVDFPALRRSLSEQIMRAYLHVTGKDQGLSSFVSGLVVGTAASIADPMIAKMVNPEALFDLLQDSQSMPSSDRAVAVGLAPDRLGNPWGLFAASVHEFRNFYISLPLDRPADQTFQLRLYLIQGKWKLAGLDLPQSLRLRLANDLARANP
jgi:hypothetical protein